jgi:hypothetical protein
MSDDVMKRVIQIIKPFAKNQEALASAGLETRILEEL